MKNVIAKVFDFFDYVFSYKINREKSKEDTQYDMRLVEVSQLKKRLSTFSIALKRSERIKVKYNEAIIQIAKLKRDIELLETSRNRYMNNCKKLRNQLNEVKEEIERLKNGAGSV